MFREKKESMVIPVPEAESNVNYYNRLYKGEFKQPKQFIHIQRKFVDSLFSVCNLSLSTSENPFFIMPKKMLIFQFTLTD